MKLESQDVHVVLGGTPVIAGISAAFSPGSLHAIVGPNGAGKSTFLRALSGGVIPASGAVLLGDEPLSSWSAPALAKIRALMEQRPETPFAMAAWQLVALGRLPHGDADEIATVEQCLARLSLSDLAGRDVHTLSGGEAQRVHLARALAQISGASGPAGWLLLDEPTAALDLGWADEILSLVRTLSEEGLGVVVVLHDLGLALRHADTVMLIDGGRAVAHGTPEQVLTEAQVSDVWGVRVRALRDEHGRTLTLVPARRDEQHPEPNSSKLPG
ncbi:MAG: ABC transporter ATP-binding protein [Myxococcales bacterium]|nr:ABC transporter ATP-binding protein [Myxococcales bacterium]